MLVLSRRSETVDQAAYTQLQTLFPLLPQTVWFAVLLGFAPCPTAITLFTVIEHPAA
jgi:hypothetical protein